MASAVEQAFQQLPERYNREMAAGLNCVIQFDVTGDGGGQWHLNFDGGDLSVHEGEAPKANLRITVAAQDWLDILEHKLDYTGAYTAGKVRMDGELPLHKKIPLLFVHTQHKPATRNIKAVADRSKAEAWVLEASNASHGNQIVQMHETRLDAEASADILRNNGYRVRIQPPAGLDVPPLEFEPASSATP